MPIVKIMLKIFHYITERLSVIFSSAQLVIVSRDKTIRFTNFFFHISLN